MKISAAKASESQTVIDFYHKLITEMKTYPHHPTWIIGIYPSDDYLKRLTVNGQVFLGKENDRVVAAMVLNNCPNEGYESVSWRVCTSNDKATVIHLLGVLPEYWGKGFGTELLMFAENLLRKNGQEALRLDVMEENIPAKKLYAENGFTEIETVRMFYESTGWTCFTMYEKDLR